MTAGPAVVRPDVDDEDRFAWAVLGSAVGVGPATFGRLVRRHGSPGQILQIARGASGADDLVAAGLPADDDGTEVAPLRREIAEAVVVASRSSRELRDRVAALGLSVMTLDDPDYPVRLRAIADPPPVLFVNGDRAVLSAEVAIAVVGTRGATEAGRRLATDVARAIALGAGVVVSGLAVGIDSAAHEAVVRVERATVAVLGSGHGRLYPATNAGLAARIVAQGGAVISELPPDLPGSRGTFPHRNRIISGLCDATVVIEAPTRSGALTTADAALAQGREVFVAPGPVGNRAYEGSLRYLRGYHGQVRIVATVPLLLEDLQFVVAVRPGAGPGTLALGETESRVAALVTEGVATVDRLVARTGLAVSTVLSALTLLEMRGLVTAAYGRYRPSGALLPELTVRRRARGP